jgi:hypothetical protein
MENKKIIFGILIKERIKDATHIQSLLTKYGCNIKTRIGLHDVDNNLCSPSGILILELIGLQSDIDTFEQELSKISEIDVKKMEFAF